MKKVFMGMVLVASYLMPVSTWGQEPSPKGDPFQINTYTTSNQGVPSVAVDPMGDFVVVWQSIGSFGDDSSTNSVQARQYDLLGDPIGDQFQVNTYTTSSQTTASVATDAVGNFVVVWESGGSGGTDTSSGSIQAQRYDAAGSPLGAEFQVNTYTTDDQSDPVVAMDAAGNFVVVWESYGSYGTDDDYNSIQGQLFDASGVAVGGEFQVNTVTAGEQNTAAVTADGQGNFIVVWHSGFVSVEAQRFDGTGAPLGGQFRVDTNGYGSNPEVGADAQGDFVVAWTAAEAGGPDDDRSSVEAQRFDTSGAPVGSQFQVNTYTTDFQEDPTIAVDSLGNFIIVWESNEDPLEALRAQYFDADGLPVGGEFLVSDSFGPANPSARMDGLGDFVVAWNQDYAPGDGSSRSVHARRYAAGMSAIFADGFESGDTSSWSSAAP